MSHADRLLKTPATFRRLTGLTPAAFRRLAGEVPDADAAARAAGGTPGRAASPPGRSPTSRSYC